MRTVGLLLCALLFLTACDSTRNLSSTNLSHIYKKSESPIHPEFQVFHAGDSSTTVYFRMLKEELLYTKKDNNLEFTTKVKLSYALHEAFESEVILDSGSVKVIELKNANDSKYISGQIKVKTRQRTLTLLEITVLDMHRGVFNTHFLRINRKDDRSGQNFLVKSIETGKPAFSNHLHLNQPSRIFHNSSATTLYGRFYKREFPIAPPPFALYNPRPFQYEADSLFVLQAGENNEFVVSVDRPGFYHFTLDSSDREGFTMFHFARDYPQTTTIDDLLLPLRFITTKREFEALTTSDTPKKALDEFWLNNANNPERARELIRNYYNRVQDANKYFSSYMEGWKTDRGMMYVVFGPPNIIYKSTHAETWIYGEENNYLSINVNFIKVENPFSDNDFRLNRSPIYKNGWYRMVDSWRQGRILTRE